MIQLSEARGNLHGAFVEVFGAHYDDANGAYRMEAKEVEVWDLAYGDIAQYFGELMEREASFLYSELIAFLAIGIPRGRRIAVLTHEDKFQYWFEGDKVQVAMKVDKLILLDKY